MAFPPARTPAGRRSREGHCNGHTKEPGTAEGGWNHVRFQPPPYPAHTGSSPPHIITIARIPPVPWYSMDHDIAGNARPSAFPHIPAEPATTSATSRLKQSGRSFRDKSLLHLRLVNTPDTMNRLSRRDRYTSSAGPILHFPEYHHAYPEQPLPHRDSRGSISFG